MLLSSSIFAYDFGDKNLGKNWSLNAQVPASEFAELTKDSYVTVTFEADQAEEEYWCIKPMDSNWTFLDPNGVGGAVLSEGKDSYVLQKEDTSVTFKVPEDFVESVKTGGMIFLGHSITLKTLTVSQEAPKTTAANTKAPAATDNKTTGSASTDNAAGGTDLKDPAKGDAPNTGIEGVAAFAGIAVISSVAMVLSKKRK